MVRSNAETVEEYLAELPPDRREAIAAIRKVVLDNLPPGYEETMYFGMIGSRFAETLHVVAVDERLRGFRH